ncbi:MAG TPA: TetR family transcriptional regulator [Pseudonocardiaceae bacterium]
MPDGPQPTIGLRERKKAKTRAAIREHAMRLFREQGYADTTVDQIADAAEVSPSTFFRYFPTKEDVVLGDDYDELWVEAFRAQPAELSPIRAIRASMHAVFGDLPPEAMQREKERIRLLKEVPELRASSMDNYMKSMTMIAEILAERIGRPADDFPVQVFAGALVGVALATMQGVINHPEDSFMGLLDRGFELLEAGLPL